jgi:hypothetical protein
MPVSDIPHKAVKAGMEKLNWIENSKSIPLFYVGSIV